MVNPEAPLQLHDAYVPLYIGDYVADTLHLTAREHRAFRLLLLHVWMRGVAADEDAELAVFAQLTLDEWRGMKAVVLPLLSAAVSRVAERIRELRKHDGRRLPPPEWDIIREVVFERDDHVCTYCGSRIALQGDHIIPLCRGGSNCFDNVTTACASCNRSKGASTPEEWRSPVGAG